MKRGEVLMLNNTLSGVKIGKVSKDGMFALLATKIALKQHVEEIEGARKTAAEELKPEGEETEEMKQEWNRKFVEFFDRYLDEDIPVELSAVSEDDFYEIVKTNDLTIQQVEFLNLIAKGGEK